MHLPPALKKTLQGSASWLPVSLSPPQDLVRVLLITAGGAFDVTTNHVVAALDPLTIAIGLDESMRVAVADSAAQLHFFDHGVERPIAVLQLGDVRFWAAGGTLLGCFEVRRGSHRCTSPLRRAWDRCLNARARWRGNRPGNFSLSGRALSSLMILYICPRPVFFVSVDDGLHENLFPMDLVGTIAPDRFALALRNSSPSVETIKRAQKVALASVPAADHRLAIELGAHHRKTAIDWSAQPFKVVRTKEFSFPTVETALRVREITILDCRPMGSHTFFLGRVVCDQSLRNGLQLYHTCGAYQHLRSRRNVPFETPDTHATP